MNNSLELIIYFESLKNIHLDRQIKITLNLSQQTPFKI